MDAIFEKRDYFQVSGERQDGFRGYPPSFHPHGELLYVIEGCIPITVDGQPHLLKKGELAVLFPYQIHSYERALDTSALIMLFDPAATIFDNTLLTKKPTYCHTEGLSLYPLFDRAVTMFQTGKHKTAAAYLNAILSELLDILPLKARSSIHENTALQALSWCAEHFTEDITLESVANALYVSPSYVSKLFSQKLHCGFREYVNALRVHKAQDLLENTDLKITQIMLQCGFRNQSSFNRIFLGKFGESPREFRSRHHQQTNHLQ